MQFGQLLRNKVPQDALFTGFLGFFRGDYFRACTRHFELFICAVAQLERLYCESWDGS